MTVGFFSPLPPERTGVADYSAALLKLLRVRGKVEIAPPRADVNLYHIGNNQLHAEIYRRALASPGVVVLHDAVLHHFALGYFSREEYIEEFVYNYGEWSRDLARSLWARRAISGSDERYFRYPLLKRLVQRSHAVIVHNPAAADMVRSHMPGAHVVEIPHLFAPPASIVRADLGLPADTTSFGVFGHLRESKRVLAVLRSFQTVADKAVLLVAGEWSSKSLAAAVEPCFQNSGIRRVPFLPSSDWWRMALATDVCVNLRQPAAGESSGIATRFMGIGKPVVVTRSAEVSRIPEHACLRIDGGLQEEAELRTVFRWLVSHRADRQAIGEAAASYIRKYHSPELISDLYWQTVVAAK